MRSRTALARLALALAVIAFGAAPALAHDAGLQRELPSNAQYVRLGVEHILGGFDHLLFLLGLILVPRRRVGDEAPEALSAAARMRELLGLISAFTVAHSITLGASVMGVVRVDANWVEVLIALSIAYVGIENLWRPGGVASRVRLTFGFGLVHGFGFASALREVGIPDGRAGLALLCFNLGVELGQLAVLALLLPLVVGMWRVARLRRMAVPALSACLALAGLVWAGARGLSASSASAASAPGEQPEALPAATAPSEIAAAPERVESVYPQRPAVLLPGVREICESFQRLPRQRAARCGVRSAGFDFSGECERMLHAAASSGALRIEADVATRCLAARNARAASSCEIEQGEEACSALLTGTLARGTTCRASFECDAGLYCQGLSPISPGRCQPPLASGARCGEQVDALATYLPLVDPRHPECAGQCQGGRCEGSASR